MAKVDKYKTFMLWLVVNILSVKCFSYANGSGNVITVEGVGSEQSSLVWLLLWVLYATADGCHECSGTVWKTKINNWLNSVEHFIFNEFKVYKILNHRYWYLVINKIVVILCSFYSLFHLSYPLVLAMAVHKLKLEKYKED